MLVSRDAAESGVAELGLSTVFAGTGACWSLFEDELWAGADDGDEAGFDEF